MWSIGFQCPPVFKPEIQKQAHHRSTHKQYEQSLHLRGSYKDDQKYAKDDYSYNINVEFKDGSEPQGVSSPKFILPEIIGKCKFRSRHHVESVDYHYDGKYHASEEESYIRACIYLSQEKGHEKSEDTTH